MFNDSSVTIQSRNNVQLSLDSPITFYSYDRQQVNIHYTTSEFKYVVNRRGEAESINCIFKLASGVIILSRAAKPKKKKLNSSEPSSSEIRAVVYQIDNHQYDALIGDGQAGEEAPSFEGGVHMRTCRCTPHLNCVSLSSNGSLATHQVWTQPAQPFARYGRGVCTCARADALHLRHV